MSVPQRFSRVMISFFIMFFLSGFFPGSPYMVMGANSAALTSNGGVHLVTFDTAYGKCYVNLPDDMTAGDTVSGKLTLLPEGKKDKHKIKNLKKLQQHSLEMAGQRISADSGWGKWNIPETGNLSVALINPKGKTISQVQVPVKSKPARVFDNFFCQHAGVAGGLFSYFGKFDGDFSTTNAIIGENVLTKWAESPRKVLLECPKDLVGLNTIKLQEGDFQGECQYRNLSIEARAAKYDLLKGESTTLTFIVRGLEGLDKNIPLRLENKTTDIVSMKSEEVCIITPGDVQPGGIYKTVRHITGIMPGRFHISAMVPVDINAIILKGPIFFDLNAASKKPDYNSALKKLVKMNELINKIIEYLNNQNLQKKGSSDPPGGAEQEKKLKYYLKRLRDLKNEIMEKLMFKALYEEMAELNKLIDDMSNSIIRLPLGLGYDTKPPSKEDIEEIIAELKKIKAKKESIEKRLPKVPEGKMDWLGLINKLLKATIEAMEKDEKTYYFGEMAGLLHQIKRYKLYALFHLPANLCMDRLDWWYDKFQRINQLLDYYEHQADREVQDRWSETADQWGHYYDWRMPIRNIRNYLKTVKKLKEDIEKKIRDFKKGIVRIREKPINPY